MPTSPVAGMAPKKPPCGSTVSICRTGCATRPAENATAAAVLATPTLLRAQGAWPGDRPIEVIVPYPPGGGVDTMARIVLPFVAQRVPGAQFVVTNRAGAGGQVGFEALFNAAP